jgi:hypothetical protein
MAYVNKILENMLNINEHFSGGGVWARNIDITWQFHSNIFHHERNYSINFDGIIIEVKYLISFN